MRRSQKSLINDVKAGAGTDRPPVPTSGGVGGQSSIPPAAGGAGRGASGGGPPHLGTVPRPEPDDFSRQARVLLAAASVHEPRITAVVRSFERQRTQLVGLDQRMKSLESAAETLRSLAVRGRVLDPVVKDLLRYRFSIPSDAYADEVRRISEGLTRDGVHMAQWQDRWADSRYKGLNTVWVLDYQSFEVQFHTPQSAAIAADSDLHTLYRSAKRMSGSELRSALLMIKARWVNVGRPPGVWPLL